MSGYRYSPDGRKRPRQFSPEQLQNGHKRRFEKSPSRDSISSASINDDVGHFDEVQKELGTGTFGKVFLCKDQKYNDYVAIKVVRSIKRYVDSAKIEADILDDIYAKQKSSGADICVKMFSQFRFNEHYCMVFETLGVSLYDLVKMNDFRRLPLWCVRDVARQMLQGIDFLSSINLIHTDLKMENVLFTHRSLRPERVDHGGREYTVQVPTDTRIKLIDFGGATYDSDRNRSTIVSTRQYRGPEVTLELGWSFPSDVWSVGCIVAEIYRGDLLFETHDELEHLALMERRLGPFPLHMADRSPVGRKYFTRSGWVRTEALPEQSWRHVQNTTDIRDFFDLSPSDGRSGIVQLMRALLTLDPRDRATAREALRFDFVWSPPPSRQHEFSARDASGSTARGRDSRHDIRPQR